MERSGYSGGQLFLALIGGAIVGAVVALLNAPSSGEELRKRIDDTARKRSDKVRRLPTAVRAAYAQGSVAAREAFVTHIHGGRVNGESERGKPRGGGGAGEPTEYHLES